MNSVVARQLEYSSWDNALDKTQRACTELKHAEQPTVYNIQYIVTLNTAACVVSWPHEDTKTPHADNIHIVVSGISPGDFNANHYDGKKGSMFIQSIMIPSPGYYRFPSDCVIHTGRGGTPRGPRVNRHLSYRTT